MYFSVFTRFMSTYFILTKILIYMNTAANQLDDHTNEDAGGGTLNIEKFELTEENYETITKTHNIVFINFFVDWCPHSRALQPLFKDVAEEFASSDAGKSKKVFLAFVDCDKDSSICEKFTVMKYPTLRIVRFGHPGAEYRDGRSKELLRSYVETQLKDPIHYFVNSPTSQYNYSEEKYIILPRLMLNQTEHTPENASNVHLVTFQRLAQAMRDYCEFVHFTSPNESISFHNGEFANEIPFEGNMTSLEELVAWARLMCRPSVRAMSFMNAEEIIEEMLPLFMLFHTTDDIASPKSFRQLVREKLRHRLGQINFLTVDATLFKVPLKAFNKDQSDLPLLMIDSFEHAYIIPMNVTLALHNSSVFEEFMDKFFDGTLHRNLHAEQSGDQPSSNEQPSSPSSNQEQQPIRTVPNSTPSQHHVEDNHNNIDENVGVTQKSIFAKLAPSKSRYTFREEL